MIGGESLSADCLLRNGETIGVPIGPVNSDFNLNHETELTSVVDLNMRIYTITVCTDPDGNLKGLELML